MELGRARRIPSMNGAGAGAGAGELRKRRTAQEAGLPDAVEPPQIQPNEKREVPDYKVNKRND